MGGVVARLASAIRQESQIRAIVTLSTPHAFPSVPLEADFESIYRVIHSRSAYLPVLSICGGVSDVQIAAEACRLQSEDPNFALTVMTSAIAGAWTSVDHQAIVWCHQVRWALAQLLLETANDSGEFLSKAKELLLGSALLQASQAGPAIELSHVPHREIAIAVRGTNASALPVDTMLRSCSKASCRDLTFSPSAYPYARNPLAPFPVPGEGTNPADIAHLLAVTDREHPVRGSLRLDGLPAGATAVAGRRCEDTVAGAAWSKSPGPARS